MQGPRFPVALVRVVAFVAAVVVATPSTAAAAQTTDVAIRTATYEPSGVAFSPGSRLRWSNTTSPSRVHDVVSSLPEYFHMSLSGSGATYAFTFRTAGYFTYYCSIHDTMLGAVSVPVAGSTVADSAGTHFHLVLGSRAWPSDSRYVSVVSVQGPADAAPRRWRTTRRPTLDYVPASAGTYTFTARVRDNQTRHFSGATDPLSLTFAG